MAVTARRWDRRDVVIATTIVAILAAGFWSISHLARLADPMARCRGREGFNATEWRDPSLAYGDAAVRGCMVDDLLARHSFRGQSRSQVVALLGEPRPTDYFSEYQIVYWLGPERGLMSVDSEWLVFRVDSLGSVSEYRLATD